MTTALIVVGMTLFFIAGAASVRFWLNPTGGTLIAAVFMLSVISGFILSAILRAAP
jgi:predicted Kef-type K+ transport protein